MMKKHGLKVIGTSLAVALSLLVFGVASSQASEFTILGKTFKELGITEEEISGEQEVSSVLKIAALNTEIVCLRQEIVPPSRALANGIIHIQVLKLICFTYEANATLGLIATCIPVDNGIQHATHEARLINAFASEGKTYALVEGSGEGKSFGTIEFEKEAGCPLPPKTKLTGSIAVEIPAEAVSQKWIFDSASEAGAALQTKFKDELKFGAQKATLSETQQIELSGKNKGEKWGVI